MKQLTYKEKEIFKYLLEPYEPAIQKMIAILKIILIIAFIIILPLSLLINHYCCQKETSVTQTIKRTCNLPDCYYALYTTVYYKDAKVKEWIDNAEDITPQQVRGRKYEADSLIRLYDKLELKYETLLNATKNPK